MERRPRVLVLGAGATGCNVAYYLRRGGSCEVEVWEKSSALASEGSLRSVRTASGVIAELGAQVLSFEMNSKTVEARCKELQAWLTRLNDPGVYINPPVGSILAHTEERPSPWWEHYAVPDGTANLLSQILATSGAELHLGRSVLSVERGDDDQLRLGYDAGTEELFDAVVVACRSDVGGLRVAAPGKVRQASLVELRGPAAEALAAVWTGSGVREMTFDNDNGLITVWSWQAPAIATVHHSDAEAGLCAWLGVQDGIQVLETHSLLQHTTAKPVGCVVASEDPLIVYAGDWCAGVGTFSGCIVSAKAAADRVEAALGRKKARAEQPGSEQ